MAIIVSNEAFSKTAKSTKFEDCPWDTIYKVSTKIYRHFQKFKFEFLSNMLEFVKAYTLHF